MMVIVVTVPIVVMMVVVIVISWLPPVIIMMMMVVVVITVAPILGELHPWLLLPVSSIFARGGVCRLELFDGVRNRLQQLRIRLRARCQWRGRRCLNRGESGHRERAGQTRNFLIHVPPHMHR